MSHAKPRQMTSSPRYPQTPGQDAFHTSRAAIMRSRKFLRGIVPPSRTRKPYRPRHRDGMAGTQCRLILAPSTRHRSVPRSWFCSIPNNQGTNPPVPSPQSLKLWLGFPLVIWRREYCQDTSPHERQKASPRDSGSPTQLGVADREASSCRETFDSRVDYQPTPLGRGFGRFRATS